MIKYFNLQLRDVFFLILYLTGLLLIAINLPKTVSMYLQEQPIIISFGAIGIWRYCWWLNHVLRASIYGYIVFPKRRVQANQLWDSGWRPKRLFIMMTTFKEIQTTTETVLQSLLSECKKINVPVTLFIGIGAESDEQIIEDFFSKKKHPTPSM